MEKETIEQLKTIIYSLEELSKNIKGFDRVKFITNINNLKIFIYDYLNPQIDFPNEKNNN